MAKRSAVIVKGGIVITPNLVIGMVSPQMPASSSIAPMFRKEAGMPRRSVSAGAEIEGRAVEFSVDINITRMKKRGGKDAVIAFRCARRCHFAFIDRRQRSRARRELYCCAHAVDC